MFETYVAGRGVYQLDGDEVRALGLAERRVSALHAWREGGCTVLLAGTYGDGVFRSADGGASWQAANDGLSAPVLRTLQPDPTEPGAILAGTEPGRAFRSRDGGRSWQELQGILQLPHVHDWYLPYSPRAGALRNFYGPPGQPRTLFASIEVGGLLRSEDAGESWAYVPVGVDHDIHWITGDPRDPQRLYAALGYAGMPWQRDEEHPPFGGVGRSRDGGASWEKLQTDYTRAVLVLPGEPRAILAAPAPHVGREGRIELSLDGGDHWLPAGDGIQMPMADMVERFYPAPDGSVWAVTSGGRLFTAMTDQWQWSSPAGERPLGAEAVAFVAG